MTSIQNSVPTLEPLSTVTAQPCVVRANEGTFYQGPGEAQTFKLTGEQTENRLTLTHAVVDVNAGPPPHVHLNEDEIFIVHSGAFEFFANGQRVEARQGDVVYGARGEAHRFRGLDSREPNVFSIIVAPSGFEKFMARWVRLFDNGAPDMEEAVKLCGEYGITLFPSDDQVPMVPTTQSKLVKADQPTLHIMGMDITVLLKAEDTQGRYGLIRGKGARGVGEPLHLHKGEDGLFLIEKGSVEIVMGSETIVAEAGDTVWIPRGVPHAFRIVSDEAQMYGFVTPGGFEGMFTELALNQLAGEMQPETMLALGERYGVTYLPPVS